MTARTPSTFVIGAGPVATALAGALRRAGVPVLGLWARRPERARAAGAVAGVASYSAAPPDLLLEADAIITAVRDDAIAEVAQMLVASGFVASRHVMIHCSGAMSAATAFGGVADQLRGVATLHPLRAIADPAETMERLAGTVFGIEGDDAGRAVALDLVRALRGKPLELADSQMAAYHAAAAVVSNYLVTLLDTGAALLAGVGIERDQALAALLPLARGALANVAERGVDDGLTGPIRRGDKDTIDKHLHALAALPSKLQQVYRVLGSQTVEIARRLEAAPAADLDAIQSMLDSPSDHD